MIVVRLMILILLGILLISCDASTASSQTDRKGEAKIEVNKAFSAHMSKTTEIVMKSNNQFCSEMSRNVSSRDGRIDTHLFPEIALRDITVDALCLDAYEDSYDGIVLAMELAMIASTLEVRFEYENLLYSLIATHQTALPAEKAWAYSHLSKNELELVDGSATFGKNSSAIAGEKTFIVMNFLQKQHLVVGK